MARQPLTLPAAIDAFEDAISGIERRVPKLQRAIVALNEVLKQTPVNDAKVFASDLESLEQRISAIKEKLE